MVGLWHHQPFQQPPPLQLPVSGPAPPSPYPFGPDSQVEQLRASNLWRWRFIEQPPRFQPDVFASGLAQTVTITSGIHVGINMGEPNVQGPPQTVVISSGLHVGINVGNPTVTGGRSGVSVFIGNIDRTNYLLGAGLSIPRGGSGAGGSGSATVGPGPITVTSTSRGRKTASFDLYVGDGSGYTPEVFQTVILNDFGKKMFGGCIKTVTTDPLNPGFGLVLFHCLCGDKGTICDNRVCIKTYSGGIIQSSTLFSGGTGWQIGDTFSVQGGDGTAVGIVDAVSAGVVTAYHLLEQGTGYVDDTAALTSAIGGGTGAALTLSIVTGGPDYQDVVLDIVQNFLNGEGIATTGVDLSALGAITNDLVFNYTTVSQAFDTISGQTGAQWWVDDNGVLYFVSPLDSPAAPYGLTSTSNNYRSFVASQTTISYANKYYAVSNLVAQPNSAEGQATVETYTLVNHGGLPFQQQAWEAGLAPGYILVTLPIVALVSVTHNGTSIPVYPASRGIQAGPGFYWFDQDQQAAVCWPANLSISIGDVIVVDYIAVYQNAQVNVGDTPAATCGSGIVEGVIQAPNIQLQSDLLAIAAAAQAYYGTVPYICNWETDTPGLLVGQAISVMIPEIGLGTYSPSAAVTLYITTVTASINSLNANASDLGEGSAFHWSIEATTQKNVGAALTWFQFLIQRSQYPLPLSRYETATLIASPGSSLLTTGTLNTNSYPVQHTGALFQVTATAAVPPTGQDLLIDFLVNGVSVLGSNLLVIPGGSTANTLYQGTTFITPNLFIFQGDIVTCAVYYRVTGASPTPAQSVTANLKWSY